VRSSLTAGGPKNGVRPVLLVQNAHEVVETFAGVESAIDGRNALPAGQGIGG